MRKIESLMVAAVAALAPRWKDSNTEVTANGRTEDRLAVYLHGNLIAVVNPATPHAPPVLQVSLAGWDTNTTRSRLNALLSAFAPAFRVARVKGKPELHNRNGTAAAMDPEAFYPVPLSADTEAGATLISNLHAREG